ncbi:nitrogenase component 1 [Tissierella pigra]|uniref:nitrogenase component 1 n=1 Tax=Tissierella pigra TaxID=2607614 RepID=UPI001C12416F|nr:nitrogenase component 1 [Tissierella pigra]MBU5425377.1 nitrogenase component 1 [Tissierella pigra]
MKQFNLEKLSKLSEINKNEDIKALSHAIFPGTHCPLFGVAMIASFIEDLVVIVAGTQECTYYAKDFAYQRQYGKDNFYSVVTNKHDITFGCEEKIKDVIFEIDKTIKPKAIMIVSTCVLELIGEDFVSLGSSIQHKVNAKILVVPTEHFKCNSHIPGMERSLEQLVTLMEKCPIDEKSINILGHRQHGVENTELMKILVEEGIHINSVIPSKTTIDELRFAPKARLNIVTDFVALPMAKKMEEKFGIPYVYFDKHLSLERIRNSYRKLEEFLGIEILSKLSSKEEELMDLMEEAKKVLKGKTFIYGNTPMMAFEVTSFLCDLGLEPILVQVRDLYENDSIYMEEIKSHGYDPYISRIANIAPMQYIYEECKPSFYFGHENPMNLAKRNIIQVTLDEVTKKLGYEIPIDSIKKILLSFQQHEEIKEKMMKIAAKGGMRHGVL